jgi:hypothetical protein
MTVAAFGAQPERAPLEPDRSERRVGRAPLAIGIFECADVLRWTRQTVGVAVCSLVAVEAEVDRLAAIIEPPRDLLPTYGYSRDLGYPHIEVQGVLMSYVTLERGKEIERHSSIDLDDILYWVFQSVTFSMAARFEVEHRVEGEDFRRLLWQKQFELLDKLNPAWTLRRRKELGSRLEEVGLQG